MEYSAFIITYCFVSAVGIGLFYLIIKLAVKNGIKSALSDIKIVQTKNGSFIISGRAAQTTNKYDDPLFDNDPFKSDTRARIEKETYVLYSKRKLPIDYTDSIENQKIAIRKIVDDKLCDK